VVYFQGDDRVLNVIHRLKVEVLLSLVGEAQAVGIVVRREGEAYSSAYKTCKKSGYGRCTVGVFIRQASGKTAKNTLTVFQALLVAAAHSAGVFLKIIDDQGGIRIVTPP